MQHGFEGVCIKNFIPSSCCLGQKSMPQDEKLTHSKWEGRTTYLPIVASEIASFLCSDLANWFLENIMSLWSLIGWTSFSKNSSLFPHCPDYWAGKEANVWLDGQWHTHKANRGRVYPNSSFQLIRVMEENLVQLSWWLNCIRFLNADYFYCDQD